MKHKLVLAIFLIILFPISGFSAPRCVLSMDKDYFQDSVGVKDWSHKEDKFVLIYPRYREFMAPFPMKVKWMIPANGGCPDTINVRVEVFRKVGPKPKHSDEEKKIKNKKNKEKTAKWEKTPYEIITKDYQVKSYFLKLDNLGISKMLRDLKGHSVVSSLKFVVYYKNSNGNKVKKERVIETPTIH